MKLTLKRIRVLVCGAQHCHVGVTAFLHTEQNQIITALQEYNIWHEALNAFRAAKPVRTVVHLGGESDGHMRG